MLRSCVCTQAQLESETFRAWMPRLGDRLRMSRKVWEYAYICQALAERQALRRGRRGLGFAVGQEPLPALFAGLGCEVLATDLETEAARVHWGNTGQHADSVAALRWRGICEPLALERVTFRFLDMRALPPAEELGTFDFLWSACALEHLGSLEAGEQLIRGALRYLRPGGVAVHTTEYTVSSNEKTVDRGAVVFYRRQDLERIAAELRELGCKVADLDFAAGDLPHDWRVEGPPYTNEHLKLGLAGHVITSFGLIIVKGQQSNG